MGYFMKIRLKLGRKLMETVFASSKLGKGETRNCGEIAGYREIIFCVFRPKLFFHE